VEAALPQEGIDRCHRLSHAGPFGVSGWFSRSDGSDPDRRRSRVWARDGNSRESKATAGLERV